jgi:hypothetical protein
MRLRLVPARVAPPPPNPTSPPTLAPHPSPPPPRLRPPPPVSPRPLALLSRQSTGARCLIGGLGPATDANKTVRRDLFDIKIGFQSFNVRAYSCCRQALAMSGCVAVPWQCACFMCKAFGIVYRCVCCVCCCGVCLLLSYSCFVSLVLLFL